MRKNETRDRSIKIMEKLQADEELCGYVDASLPIPEVFGHEAEIHLIVLGQDPTVKNIASRKNVRVVLNLDRNGSLRTYLEKICKGLGIQLDQHVLATNLVKNFFIEPPANYGRAILERAAIFWKPLLLDELGLAPDAPIISLGEPLLEVIAIPPASHRVRDYWGYSKGAQQGRADQFRCLLPSENVLERNIFPMPHQPSVRKAYYRNTLDDYLCFIKESTSLNISQ